MRKEFRLTIAVAGLHVVALVLAAQAAFALLRGPQYVGVGPNGTVEHASLVEINGPGVIWKVLFPVALALAAVVVPVQKVRVVATILIWAFVLLGSMTIGLRYFAAAAAMLVATSAGYFAQRMRATRRDG
ncbi:MAG: hypothetical protein KGN36_09075 [Acidobacteriota bacterium]|nr:hypothetical protein [Acidobacteriota bacterium]